LLDVVLGKRHRLQLLLLKLLMLLLLTLVEEVQLEVQQPHQTVIAASAAFLARCGPLMVRSSFRSISNGDFLGGGNSAHTRPADLRSFLDGGRRNAR